MGWKPIDEWLDEQDEQRDGSDDERVARQLGRGSVAMIRRQPGK